MGVFAVSHAHSTTAAALIAILIEPTPNRPTFPSLSLIKTFTSSSVVVELVS